MQWKAYQRVCPRRQQPIKVPTCDLPLVRFIPIVAFLACSSTEIEGRAKPIDGGLDVGAEMVDRGLAVAYRRYSLKYVPNEEQAKAAKRGLWAGTFEMPREYRARTFGGGNAQGVIPNDPGTCPPPPPDPRPPQCAIKGNIGSGKGRPRIYHVPGSRGYEAVAVAPAKGERYFCSEQEAITCGWRKGPG